MFPRGKIAKVLYEKDGEITSKQFLLDRRGPGTYNDLCEKVERSFGLTDTGKWILCAKGGPADTTYLPICNNEALDDYMCSNRGKKFKFFIDPHPTRFHTPETCLVRHLAILCNSCKQPVNGNRFKCTVCQDFDLCETCFEMKVHNEHDMLVIRRHNMFPEGVQKILRDLSFAYRNHKMDFPDSKADDFDSSFKSSQETDPKSTDWKREEELDSLDASLNERKQGKDEIGEQGKQSENDDSGEESDYEWIDPDFPYRDELNRMRSMGYTDEGGRLQFLLKEHDGNIIKVVDIFTGKPDF